MSLPTSSKPLAKHQNPPENVTHVYTRQFDTRGLDSKYQGPFKVISRPSPTTVEIKVGQNKDNSNRTEIRHWSQCKEAHLRDDATEALRPKRGRPRKPPPSDDVVSPTSTSSQTPTTSTDTSVDQNKQSDPPNSNYNLRTRGKINYASAIDVTTIDFSKPPPAGNSKILATHAEPISVTGPPPYGGFLQNEAWSASQHDLNIINASISSSPVRCEARG